MNVPEFIFRVRTSVRPPTISDGELAYLLPNALARKRQELALTISLMTHRRLFGEVYAGLQPDYFWDMAPDSGVYLTPIFATSKLTSARGIPGDIDLLVLPYEADTLVLHRALAIEIKVIRASFAKQGQSPNDMGISQAKGLVALGFPYVALMHLIISDESPEEAWREIGIARVLDKHGRAEFLPSMNVDWMPIDLMERAFGRLCAAAPLQTSLGLVAAYLDPKVEKHLKGQAYLSTWIPTTRRASLNETINCNLLRRIAEAFERKPDEFLDTPRYDPD